MCGVTLTKTRHGLVGVDYGRYQSRGVTVINVTLADTVQLAGVTE